MENQVAEIGKVKLEEFKELIATAPSILEQNRASEAKAIAKGKELIEMAKSGMNDQVDTLIADYIEKANKTITSTNVKRKPITQMLTLVAKEFTSIESNIQKIVDECKDYRNEYATAKMKKKQEEERLAALKLAKDQEAIEVVKNYKIEYAQAYANYIVAFKTKKNEWFNALTLETIDLAALEIAKFDNNLSDGTFLFDVKIMEVKHHNASELSDLLPTMSLCYESLDSFKRDIKEFQQELIDMLPSKKTQLEELEKQRLADIKAKEEEAERKRLADIKAAEAKAKADAEADLKKKAELEEQAAKAAEQAAKAKAEADAAEVERKKKADEAEAAEKQRQADAAEQLKKDAEAEQLKKTAEASVKASGQMASAMVDTQATLFDAAPKVKESYSIKVLNQAAYLQIAQFWYENEGKNTPIDKIEAMTFGRMKAFCEKYAIKNDVFIDSKLLVYEEVYKAK